MTRTLDSDFNVTQLDREGKLGVGDVVELVLKDSYQVDVRENKQGEPYVIVSQGEHVPLHKRCFFATFEGYHVSGDPSVKNEPYQIDLHPVNARGMSGERIDETMIESFIRFAKDYASEREYRAKSLYPSLERS